MRKFVSVPGTEYFSLPYFDHEQFDKHSLFILSYVFFGDMS